VVVAIIMPIGTLVSGTIFLLAAQAIVGLPGASFTALFLAVVFPPNITAIFLLFIFDSPLLIYLFLYNLQKHVKILFLFQIQST
ncbi:tryptophan transporter, partial [Clostridioides difficile]